MTGLKRVTELAFDSHKDKDKQISNEVFKRLHAASGNDHYQLVTEISLLQSAASCPVNVTPALQISFLHKKWRTCSSDPPLRRRGKQMVLSGSKTSQRKISTGELSPTMDTKSTFIHSAK